MIRQIKPTKETGNATGSKIQNQFRFISPNIFNKIRIITKYTSVFIRFVVNYPFNLL